MRVVYTSTARRHIASQIGYLIDHGASAPAKRLRVRITSFIRDVLARYPRTGRPISDGDCYESYIPRTRFVDVYRVDAESDTLIVLALFHAAQDRSDFDPSQT